jgi:thermitase
MGVMRRGLLAMLLLALAAPASASAAAPVVAVLDSGVDLRHRDLRGSAWANPGEIPGNRIDDDANGFVDDVRGIDLVDGDARPADPRGHGTHIAGIVHRRARGARIMAVRISGRAGKARTAALVDGIAYAAAEGADVINVSMAYFPDRDAVEAALRAAGDAGVLVVAAAGNGGEDLDRSPAVPAGLGLPNLVSVAALDRSGAVASWSAHGRRTVEIAAPGVGIRSALPGGRHGRLSGTSQAAAHVSGAAARLVAAAPRATPAQVREALIDGARDLRQVSGGAVQVTDAVAALVGLLG